MPRPKEPVEKPITEFIYINITAHCTLPDTLKCLSESKPSHLIHFKLRKKMRVRLPCQLANCHSRSSQFAQQLQQRSTEGICVHMYFVCICTIAIYIIQCFVEKKMQILMLGLYTVISSQRYFLLSKHKLNRVPFICKYNHLDSVRF